MTKLETIFCIHGNSSSAKIYDDLLQSKEIEQKVIALDLIGHGENQSSNFDVNDLSFEAQKRFLITEISKIEGNILLIGNSLGGHLAIEIAEEIPNLKGLVIMGTPPLKKPLNFEEAFVPVEGLDTFFTEHPEEETIYTTINKVVVNKGKVASIVEDFKKANPLVRVALANDLNEANFMDEYTIFKELAIPKYIISGDTDISINRDYLESLKNECADSCKIIDIENCGHYASADKPLEFIQKIKEITKEVFI